VEGILLFGGSFDPIHHGHLIVARFAAETLGITRIVLIPGARPPHKQPAALTAAEARLELCHLAVRGDKLFDVSDWETQQAGPNYTLHTVQHFREAASSDVRLHWLIGMDSLAELATWYRVGELAELCTLVTVGRPGSAWPEREALRAHLSAEQIRALEQHTLQSPLIDISSTDIRQRVRAGRSIRYLVPEAVRGAIEARGLYRGR